MADEFTGPSMAELRAMRSNSSSAHSSPREIGNKGKSLFSASLSSNELVVALDDGSPKAKQVSARRRTTFLSRRKTEAPSTNQNSDDSDSEDDFTCELPKNTTTQIARSHSTGNSRKEFYANEAFTSCPLATHQQSIRAPVDSRLVCRSTGETCEFWRGVSKNANSFVDGSETVEEDDDVSIFDAVGPKRGTLTRKSLSHRTRSATSSTTAVRTGGSGVAGDDLGHTLCDSNLDFVLTILKTKAMRLQKNQTKHADVDVVWRSESVARLKLKKRSSRLLHCVRTFDGGVAYAFRKAKAKGRRFFFVFEGLAKDLHPDRAKYLLALSRSRVVLKVRDDSSGEFSSAVVEFDASEPDPKIKIAKGADLVLVACCFSLADRFRTYPAFEVKPLGL